LHPILWPCLDWQQDAETNNHRKIVSVHAIISRGYISSLAIAKIALLIWTVKGSNAGNQRDAVGIDRTGKRPKDHAETRRRGEPRTDKMTTGNIGVASCHLSFWTPRRVV